MQIHVVEQGETLWQIANRYGVDLSQIMLANQPEYPDMLVRGEALVIPNPEREYLVEPGDQLQSIAAKYGVTIEDLAVANHIIDGAYLFVGAFLVIPYTQYTVESGDTLSQIARRFDVTAERIANASGLSADMMLFPGMILRIPFNDKEEIDVCGFISELGEVGQETVLRHGNNLTHLLPFSYQMKEDGQIQELADTEVVEAAHLQQASPLLVLTNVRDGFDSDLAATILRNPGLQDTLIANVLAEIKEKGYRGINFDFEYVYPEDRENYNNFLRRVVSQFHPLDLLVTTSVAPKTSEEQTGLLYEAHDYETHGEIVDFVILMTYEWGWSGGEPYAISPVNRIRDVLDYATQVIPSEKVVLGVSIYGRDWKIPWQEGTTARTISPQEALRLAKEHQVMIQYNDMYEAPFFYYTDETGQRHEVWFEDARSTQAKYDLVHDYNLRGVSFWDLRYPFPQNWPVLRINFNVNKM